MKVLLDENLPRRLLRSVRHHDSKTVADMGWKGIKNGELIKPIDSFSFVVFLTGDKNFSKQQNLTRRRVAVVVLTAIQCPIIRHHLETIAHGVDTALPGGITQVSCGAFLSLRRQKPHSSQL